MIRKIIILIVSVLILSGCEHKDYFAENNMKPEITVSIDGENYSKSINDSVKAGFSQLRAYYRVGDDNNQYSIKIDYSGLNVSENEIDRSITIDSDSVINCTIKLIVEDPYGETDNCDINITSFDNLAPVAKFQVTETSGYAVNISAAGSYDKDAKYGGYIEKYRYQILPEFDIQVNFNEINYNFGRTGIYEIRVSVMDNQGMWSDQEKAIVNIE